LKSIGTTNKIIEEYVNLNVTNDAIYFNKTNPNRPHICRVELKTSLPNNVQLNGSNFEIEFEIVTKISITGTCFSFQIQDANGRNYVHQWIFDVDKEFCRTPGVYVLTCIIPSLRLYMGKYTVKCYFSEPPGGKIFEILDGICPFEVVMYETGRSLFQWQSSTCAYIENANWNILSK
jgi:lipopolysaccharide transport system ATP-binding protein